MKDVWVNKSRKKKKGPVRARNTRRRALVKRRHKLSRTPKDGAGPPRRWNVPN